MNTRRNWFLFALTVPLLVLVFMVYKPLTTYMFGEKIILETNPVDPTSILYGDYMMIPLAITEVPTDKLSESLLKEISNQSNKGAFFPKKIDVYTELEKNGNIYEPKLVTDEKPKKGVYLKGKTAVYMYGSNQPSIFIDYGIDRYYIEENTGAHLEQLAMNGQLQVALKVKNGYGYIEKLIME